MYANLSTIKMVEFLDIEIRARGKRNENGRKPKKKKNRHRRVAFSSLTCCRDRHDLKVRRRL